MGWVGATFGARWTLIGGGLMSLLGIGVALLVYRGLSTGRGSPSAARSGRRARRPPTSSSRRDLCEPAYTRPVNPRYRRMVIPVALGGLILIVVVAALLK